MTLTVTKRRLGVRGNILWLCLFGVYRVLWHPSYQFSIVATAATDVLGAKASCLRIDRRGLRAGGARIHKTAWQVL